jgi:hypothetical protein
MDTRRLLQSASHAVALTFGFADPALAALFWSDGFDYADGQLTDSEFGGAPGDNVSGGTWTAHSGDTFDDNVAVTGSQVQVLNSGSEDVNRLTGSTMGPGDKYYFAAKLLVNFTGTAGDAINNDYFLHLKGGAFGFRGRIYLDNPNVAGSGYTLGLSATSGGQVAKWATDLSFGAPQIVVGSYDFDSGESRLWVNPAGSSSTSLADTGGALTAIGAVAFRQDFITPGTPNNEILIDHVAVGSDFDSVLGAVSAPIPEPSGAPSLDYRRLTDRAGPLPPVNRRTAMSRLHGD